MSHRTQGVLHLFWRIAARSRTGSTARRLGAVALLLLLLLVAAAAMPGCRSGPGTRADFYVAPTGNDADPGSEQQPFASLARARHAVRQLKQTVPQRDVVVLLRGGTYRLTETVVFSLEDSGAEGQRIVYAAYPGEVPVFSSGVPLAGWAKLDSDPAGVTEEARGKLWAADVPNVLARFSSLYDGERRLPRARGTGFFPTKDWETGKDLDRFTLPFPKGALKNWPNLEDVEVVIRPNYAWVLNILPLESVDEAAGIAKTGVPATYRMVQVRYVGDMLKEMGSVWVENVMEALDEPGEWVLDSKNGKVYLWPPGDQPGDGIVAPALTEFIRVEGRTDYDGPEDTPVRNLVFRGLTFTHGDRFSWQREKTGWGLQHDWEMFDRPTAMLRLRGAANVSIENCRFWHSSGAAIRMDLHSQRNRVVDSVIEHVGGAGIVLAGYGPGTKDVNRQNVLAGNHIHHVGEILWHSPAIFVWQSGENRIAHNLIHHTPYTGIVVSGRIGWDREGQSECSRTVRWHEVDAQLGKDFPQGPPETLDWNQREKYLHGRNNVIERNEIHHVMEMLRDGNGVYVSGTGTGNVVRENYVHDNPAPTMNAAIRCDDDQHGATIERNVIFRNRGSGNGIAIKGINNVVNNFIVDLKSDHGHRGYISLEESPVTGSVIQRNILYATERGSNVYFQRGLFGPDPHLKDTQADFNVYFHTEDPEWGEKHLARERPHGIELNSIAADPGFVDPLNGNFELRPDSAAVRLGVEPIDLSQIGLKKQLATAAGPQGEE